MSDTVLATEAAVHHAHEAYLTSINSNDVAQFLTTVTDDIVFLPPNSEPMTGKEAVGAWVAGYFEAIQTVWTKTTVELVVADALAYEWYRYHVVDSPRDGGESATDTGNGVNIYRIDADGTWRVWRDIWGDRTLSPRRTRSVALGDPARRPAPEYAYSVSQPGTPR